MTATLTEFDTLVAALVAFRIPREKAEVAARRQLGMPATPQESARDASIRESAEQAAIVKLFREHGFTVRSTSQARATKIAIGFPDLFVTHKRLPLAFFFETKRQVRGVISDAQKEFGEDCARCNVRWYAGDRYEAQRVLDEHHITG